MQALTDYCLGSQIKSFWQYLNIYKIPLPLNENTGRTYGFLLTLRQTEMKIISIYGNMTHIYFLFYLKRKELKIKSSGTKVP